jgi:hypothetical protein
MISNLLPVTTINEAEDSEVWLQLNWKALATATRLYTERTMFVPVVGATSPTVLRDTSSVEYGVCPIRRMAYNPIQIKSSLKEVHIAEKSTHYGPANPRNRQLSVHRPFCLSHHASIN